jgi:hypothetical protein
MSPLSPNDSLQARLRAAADRKAADAVERHSELRGEQALRVARRAVAAAAPELRTMYAQKMGGTSAREATAAGLAFTATAAVELAAYVALFRQAGPKTKALAGAAIAAHVAVFAYSRYKHRVVRRAAAVELVKHKVSEMRAA